MTLPPLSFIDQQELVNMIGKPVGCNTCGDLADLCVWIMGTEYGRIDVVCNIIYMKLSIKGSTCNRRK